MERKARGTGPSLFLRFFHFLTRFTPQRFAPWSGVRGPTSHLVVLRHSTSTPADQYSRAAQDKPKNNNNSHPRSSRKGSDEACLISLVLYLFLPRQGLAQTDARDGPCSPQESVPLLVSLFSVPLHSVSPVCYLRFFLIPSYSKPRHHLPLCPTTRQTDAALLCKGIKLHQLSWSRLTTGWPRKHIPPALIKSCAVQQALQALKLASCPARNLDSFGPPDQTRLPPSSAPPPSRSVHSQAAFHRQPWRWTPLAHSLVCL